jgi:hypothetical protein
MPLERNARAFLGTLLKNCGDRHYQGTDTV